MKKVIIIGAGGFARELYQWSKDAIFPRDSYEIKGFLSSNQNDLNRFKIDLKILGDENSYEIEREDYFLLAIGDIQIRQKVVAILRKRGARFVSFIHPTAIITNTARLGIGHVVFPYVSISDSAQVGDFVFLNNYSSIGHDAVVGNNVVFGPYAVINGKARIEDNILLGTHSTVLRDICIGGNSKISAGAVVNKSMPEDSIIFGNPAKATKLYSK